MLTPTEVAKIKEELLTCKRPLFLFHDDPDGLASFLHEVPAHVAFAAPQDDWRNQPPEPVNVADFAVGLPRRQRPPRIRLGKGRPLFCARSFDRFR